MDEIDCLVLGYTVWIGMFVSSCAMRFHAGTKIDLKQPDAIARFAAVMLPLAAQLLKALLLQLAPSQLRQQLLPQNALLRSQMRLFWLRHLL
jgi:hypothetical protein